MHLADGVAADGTRVLSQESAHAMREKQVDLPRLTGMGDAWGLGWEIIQTAAPVVIGHDGGTIGQSAFLRVVPELGIAVAMLTNGGDVMGLFDDVVAPIIKETAGVTLHGFPVPHAEPVPVDPAPLVGFYSNSTIDLTVSLDDEGRIWVDSTPKGILAEMGQTPEHTELRRLQHGLAHHRRAGDPGHARRLLVHRRRRGQPAQVHPLRSRGVTRRLTRHPPVPTAPSRTTASPPDSEKRPA